MTRSFPYRLATWLSLLGIVAYLAWITTAPSGFPGAPVAAGVMVGVLLLILYWRPAHAGVYWEAVSEPPQFPRVMVLIATTLGVQLAVGAVLQLAGRLDWIASAALALAVWTIIPLSMLATGYVRWPRRLAHPPRGDALVIAGFALLLALGVCLLAWIPNAEPRAAPAPGTVAADAAVLVVGGTMEEVVFRVLLLTAIIRASGSRLQAIVLSTVVFALGHVPLALAEPVVALDWHFLADKASAFWPEMVWKLGFGALLGALWVRTGSIVLIAVVHALLNLGPVLAQGLQSWA